MIQTQHATKSIRTTFDPSMIYVTAIMERDIPAYSILHTDKDDVLVYDETKKLTLYDDQLVQKKKLSVPSTLFDMVLTASQDIIATDNDNRRVIKITQTRDVRTIFSTAPLHPWGICSNNIGHIVVGMEVEPGKPPIKLVVYSHDGFAVLQEIENDENGKPLFRRGITRVKQNGCGDYVVADDCRVVCVSSDGRFSWDYRVGLHEIY